MRVAPLVVSFEGLVEVCVQVSSVVPGEPTLVVFDELLEVGAVDSTTVKVPKQICCVVAVAIPPLFFFHTC